ncbi:MAG: alpha,alpha-trehalose-phosphate synthase (UDP-forming) [Candidatus Limnocylindria bacterium]
MTAAGRMVLVSNRAPIAFIDRAGGLRAARGGGGVVTALRDLVRVSPVTWLASATATADLRAARMRLEHGGLFGGGRLALRPVPIGRDLAAGHREFSDRVLWFVQHGMWHRRVGPESPERIRWLLGRYRLAARAFADAAVSEAHRPGHSGTTLVHDYQLYLVPGMVRRGLPGTAIAHFTHIPWPALDVWLAAVPADVVAHLARGLLAADVLHFQTAASVRSFLSCVEALLPDAEVAGDLVRRGEHRTLVRARAVSIDPSALRARPSLVDRLRADPRRLVVRVDRGDPMKNVPAGFLAFERMLERRPDLVGNVRFRARIVPTRMALPEYAAEQELARTIAARIDDRFGRGTVELVERADRPQALAELAAADVVLVNSLADGMNLVAKEAAVLNPHVALVLSRTAGAYEELADGALGIDPEDLGGTADALVTALEMPEAERLRRAASMREKVLGWTSRDWLRSQLDDLDEARAGDDGRREAGPASWVVRGPRVVARSA